MRAVPFDRSGQAQIGRRQIYILPTGFGGLYAGVLFTLFLGSLNELNNLGLLFTFLLAAVGLVAMLHTWRNLLGVRVRIGEGRPVFAGEPAGLAVEVADPAGRERPGLILAAGEERLAFALEPKAAAGLELAVPTRRRGAQRLGRLRIETRYPLGLFSAWSYLDSPAGVLVYPRPAARAPEGIAEASGTEPAGGRADGTGVEDFVGLRPYQAGDALSRLYWKALARGGGLLVKQFAAEQGEALWLDWDALGAADPEERISLLCRQVLAADARGARLWAAAARPDPAAGRGGRAPPPLPTGPGPVRHRWGRLSEPNHPRWPCVSP